MKEVLATCAHCGVPYPANEPHHCTGLPPVGSVQAAPVTTFATPPNPTAWWVDRCHAAEAERDAVRAALEQSFKREADLSALLRKSHKREKELVAAGRAAGRVSGRAVRHASRVARDLSVTCDLLRRVTDCARRLALNWAAKDIPEGDQEAVREAVAWLAGQAQHKED